MKTKLAALVIGLWILAVLVGCVLYLWVSPLIIARAPTLPSIQLQPQFLSKSLAVPLLIILGAVLFRRTRRSAVKILVGCIAFAAACLPSYQVMMAMRATNNSDAIGRMHLASAMLLYCFGLALLLGMVFLVQVAKIKRQAELCPPPLPRAPQPGHSEGED